MSRPVVVTRPVAQATALARRLAVLGRRVVVFPLLEICPLDEDAALRRELERLPDYALVAFVSPNAIDAVFSRMAAWPRQVSIAIVGPGSARALERHGITDAGATIIRPLRTDRTDSETLLEAMDLKALRGRSVLIVRGESGRELMADAFRRAGARVTQVPAYRRQAPPLTDARREELAGLLDAQADWIITSSEALGILVDQVRRTAGDAGVQKLQHHSLIVPHARIGEVAKLHGFRQVVLTGSGDDSLLAALQSRP